MSSQQPANSAVTQPPADPRRPKQNSGAAPPPAKPPHGAKPVARPTAPRKNLKTSTPAKPTKKKSESWIDSIKSVLSCCSSKKKSPAHAKGKPVAKQPVRPGVKAAPGKPGVKAMPQKQAPPRSDSSIRPSRKAMAQAKANARLAPRGKTREPLPSESRSGSKSRSKEAVKKSSRSKEHHKRSRSKEQPIGDIQKVVVDSGKKRGSKDKVKEEPKEHVNSKRSKEPIVDAAIKTAELWNEDEVSKTDNEEKEKIKKGRKETQAPDPMKPVQSLYINRFMTEGRQVFRWTYEESFPEGERAQGMAKLFDHRPREIDRHKLVASEVCKKAKEEPQSPKSQPTPTSAVESENETPKRKKKTENYFDPQEVLRKTKKIENYVDPQQVLCCFCCDCEGNQELRKKKKNEIKI